MPRKKNAHAATGDLTFLVATSMEKPDPNTRKFIRSQVMIGKNAGKQLCPPERPQGQVEPHPIDDKRAPTETSVICCRLASSRSAIVLADVIEHEELTAILQLSSVAKQILFALEPVIFFERRNEDWTVPLTTDAAYLYSQVFNTYLFSRAVHKRNTGQEIPFSRRAIDSYSKTLRLLSDRLKDKNDDMRFSNSTLATMIGLSGFSLLNGDFATTSKHVNGMFQIIRGRGGVETLLDGSEKILIEILSRDLGIALAQGSVPFFAAMTSVNEPLLQYPDLTPLMKPYGLVSRATRLESRCGDLDEAWNTIADFSNLVNFAAARDHRITTFNFLHTMASVMYRLLNISFDYSTRDEMVRLGLLAYTSTVFLPWRSLGLSYEYLASNFTRHFTRWMATEGTTRFGLWLSMMVTISMADKSDDHRFQPYLNLHAGIDGVESWEAMRELMREFLWIDLVHDQPGRRIFNWWMRESIGPHEPQPQVAATVMTHHQSLAA